MNKLVVSFIINPRSGIGRHRAIETAVFEHLDLSRFEPRFFYTAAPNDATNLAQTASRNSDWIVAVGGDGTINEVAKALVNTPIPMGIIPVGSGNGLARHLGIPTHSIDAIQILNQGDVTAIDTVTANNLFFVSIAGLGFDATIAENIMNARLRGFFAYLYLSARHYAFYKPKKYTIRIGDQTLVRKALLISIANGSQFGYGVTIAKDADICDGMMDVVIIKKPRTFHTFFTLLHLLQRSLNESPYVETWRVKTIQIQQNTPHYINIDGEACQVDQNVTFTMHPLSLHVVLPKH